MDEVGIDAVVTSASLIGEVADLELSAAKETTAFINEAAASAQRQHPGRVYGTAMLPVQDVAASIETVDRAIELGLRAICMVSNAAGRPIATNETLPLYQHIEASGLPIILHPASTSVAAASGIDAVAEVGVGSMFDTTAAALSLITSGTLDACPNLQIVHPHLGGVLPFLKGRLDVTLQLWGTTELAHPLDHYLRHNFYVDSVSQTPGALPLAVEYYGVDRILFASDYPWIPAAAARPYVERSAPDAADARTDPVRKSAAVRRFGLTGTISRRAADEDHRHRGAHVPARRSRGGGRAAPSASRQRRRTARRGSARRGFG